MTLVRFYTSIVIMFFGGAWFTFADQADERWFGAKPDFIVPGILLFLALVGLAAGVISGAISGRRYPTPKPKETEDGPRG